MNYLFNNFESMSIDSLQAAMNTVFSNGSDLSTINVHEENQIDNILYGCQHYFRRAKIVAPCCDKVFWCRLCHDEHYNDEHKVDRYQIKEMVCTSCNKRQEFKQNCEDCSALMGIFYCEVCHLLTDIDREIYHCYKCGMCRVGGRDNFKHCDKCGVCVPKNSDHGNCMNIYDCPICMEDIKTSTLGFMKMRCGHYIHSYCFKGLIENDIKCPTCLRCIVDPEKYNDAMEREINLTPMPKEYDDMMVKIMCNECLKESEVKFHIIGAKCSECGSYNTRKV